MRNRRSMGARATVVTSSLLAVCTAVIIGCATDALEPSEIGGDYSLQTIDGTPLPRYVRHTGGCDITASAGRLLIGTDGRFEMSIDEIVDCSATGGDSLITNEGLAGTYEVRSDDITFTVTGLDASFPIVGHASDNRIELILVGADETTSEVTTRHLLFARIGDL